MLSVSNENQKVFYHELGTPQSDDKLIFEEPTHPKRYYGAQVTDDERFLIISSAEGTDGNEIWMRDLSRNETTFRKILPGFAYNYNVIDNDGDRLLVLTNHQADRQHVVSIDPSDPSPAKWKTVIPEQKEALTTVGNAGNRLFAQYLADASSKVSVYGYDGKMERNIQVPGIGTVAGFSGSKKDNMVYYGYSSFTTPFEQYAYDIASGTSKLFRKTELPYDTKQYETTQKFFTSKDGAKVPVFITHKKGMTLDGNNPCMLYGYGGFNVPLTPGFSASNMLFLENGGIYAVANLRGGSEYGEEWHKAGMLLNKQNVFDDFIGAAEFLIKEKYTSPNKLSIYGRSNGGLLVGAAMLQRPELFKVALPTVGVLDMLRYHKFTVGWGWAVEYGSADSSLYFPYLYKYSPLHNVKTGVNYPATMIMTADHDDRVVPAHSFKFAATLQEKYKGDEPMLIRIETKAGHGSGGAGSISKIIEQETDRWAFVFYNLNMPFGT
jgi:prolyl oligopeptidase